MTRDRILAAARSVPEREGLSNLTVRKVVARARLSPMAIYRHFADKDTLLNALMEEGLAAWEKAARAIRAIDPMTWLEELSEAHLEFALSQPHLYRANRFSSEKQFRSLYRTTVRHCLDSFKPAVRSQ